MLQRGMKSHKRPTAPRSALMAFMKARLPRRHSGTRGGCYDAVLRNSRCNRQSLDAPFASNVPMSASVRYMSGSTVSLCVWRGFQFCLHHARHCSSLEFSEIRPPSLGTSAKDMGTGPNRTTSHRTRALPMHEDPHKTSSVKTMQGARSCPGQRSAPLVCLSTTSGHSAPIAHLS
jgi:hypothetical protein